MDTATLQEEKRLVSAQMPARLVIRLAELARANERSLSAELRIAATEHLEREEEQ